MHEPGSRSSLRLALSEAGFQRTSPAQWLLKQRQGPRAMSALLRTSGAAESPMARVANTDGGNGMASICLLLLLDVAVYGQTRFRDVKGELQIMLVHFPLSSLLASYSRCKVAQKAE